MNENGVQQDKIKEEISIWSKLEYKLICKFFMNSLRNVKISIWAKTWRLRKRGNAKISIGAD
jgi:hypothetical protein